MKAGIFGGAFDPVHRGHTQLAQSFVDELSPDLLILVPTARPPHRDMPALASKDDRLHMLSAAFSSFEHVLVSDIEFTRSGKSYTYDTVRALSEQLRAEFPGESIELYLLIGSDEFMNFHKWYNYKALLEMVTLYTARRAGMPKEEMLSYAKKALAGCRFILSGCEILPASSSEIRQCIRLHRDFSAFLDVEVYNYIDNKGLYGV